MYTSSLYRVRVVELTFVGLSLCALAQDALGQTLAVSKRFDSVSAPAAYTIPGFDGGFRQQSLIDPVRLSGLGGKSITGLAVRRDLDDRIAMKGGAIDLVIIFSRHALHRARGPSGRRR